MKRSGKKIVSLISIVLILLSLLSAFAYASAVASDYSVSKTAEWTDNEKTQMDIVIQEVRSPNATAPQILFVGTLCDQHDLTLDTVYTALAATAQYGDVDCYLYGNGWEGGVVERKYHATIPMLTLKRSDYSTDPEFEKAQIDYIKNIDATYTENEGSSTSTVKIGSIQLIEGQHTCVYDFAELFAGFKDAGTNYDYVVFEFDGLRMGHTSYSPTTTDRANLVSASQWIQDYYTNDKIAWIIPDKNHKRTGEKYVSDDAKNYQNTGNTYMYNEWFFDNIQGDYKKTTPVRDCIYLLAPEDLKNNAVVGTIEDQTTLTTFKKRATDTGDTGIWVNYNSAANVKVFLDKKLAKYSINMVDVVVPGFTVTGVKGQYSSDEGTTWTDITANDTSGSDKDKLTVTQSLIETGTEVTGYFNLQKIYNDYNAKTGHWVRLVISCGLKQTDTTESDYIFTDENNYTVETNVENAVITSIEASKITVNEVESPELERITEYTISYELNGGKLEEGTSNPATYTSKTDDITLNNPTREGYIFKGWTGGVIVDETVPKDVQNKETVTIEKGSTGNRKYVADWEAVPSLNITKDVKIKDGTESVAGKKLNAGTVLTYSVTVKNVHPDAETVVTVKDEVPGGLEIVKDSISDGGSVGLLASHTITWEGISLKAGETKVLTYQVTLPEDISSETPYSNKAYVSEAGGKDYTGTGSETSPASVTITAVPKVNIEIVKNWSDGWDNHKEDTIYVNLYANGVYLKQYTLEKSLLLAANKKIEDTLPALDDNGNKIEYTVAEMSSGEEDVSPVEADGLYSKDCKVSYETKAGEKAADPTVYTITNAYFVEAEDLTIEKKGSAENAKAGEEYTYTLTVKNNNQHEATAEKVVVTDVVPTGLEIVSPTASDTVSISGQTVTWTVGSLAAGKTATLEIKVKIPEDAKAERYTNQAKITSLGGTTIPEDKQPESKEVTLDVRSYTVTKVWKNADGTKITDTSKLPSVDVDVELYKDGVKYDSCTLSSQNNWTYTFTKLPLYSGDKVAAYTVKEIEVDGYTTTITPSESDKSETYGYTSAEISNTKVVNITYEVVGEKPTGSKIPDGETQASGLAYTSSKDYGSSENYTFSGWYTDDDFAAEHKYVDGTVLNADLTLYGKWSYVLKPDDFTLEKTGKAASDKTGATAKAGEEYTYTLSVKNTNTSTTADSLVITDVVPSGLTILSPAASETVSISGQTLSWTVKNLAPNATASLDIKVKIPEGIKAEQYKNQIKLTSLNGTDVPENKQPKSQETKLDVRSYSITKVWRNADKTTMEDTSAQPAVEVVLLKDGTEYARHTLQYNAEAADKGWSYTFTNLPLYNGEKLAEYTVKEIDIDGYATSITPSETDKSDTYGYTSAEIINTIGVKVTYHFVGDAPSGTKLPVSVEQETGKAFVASTDYGSSEGYTFSGWYTDENCTAGNEFESTAELKSNLNLYGKWIPVSKYTVSKEVKYDGKDASAKEIYSNRTVTFYINITNENPAVAMSPVLVDDLPSGLEPVAGSISDGGVYDPTAGTITWNIENLAAKGSKQVSFNATIPATLTEIREYENLAFVSQSNGETYDGPCDAEDPAGVLLYGVPVKVITISKDWSDKWENHSSESVSINVYGNGALVDTVVLSSAETSKTIFVDAVDDLGATIAYTYKEVSSSDPNVEIEKDGMNGLYKFTFEETDDKSVATAGVIVTVNNEYQIQPEDLTFDKTAGDTAVAGGTITYTLKVTNNRTYETAKNVVIEDVLPEGLSLKADSISKSGAEDTFEQDTENPSKYVWNISEIKPGESGMVQLSFTVDVPEEVTAVEYMNQAYIKEIGGTDCEKPSPEAKTTIRNFTVSKAWYNSDETVISDTSEMPDVTVTLYQNGTTCDTQVLSYTNNWTYTWDSLSLLDTEGTPYAYTVSEKEVTGYSASYDYGAHSDKYGDAAAVIKNTLKKITVNYEFLGEDQPAGVQTPDSDTLDYGDTYNSEATPSTEGIPNKYYTFGGWFIDEECETPYEEGMELNSTNVPSGTLTLYGKWIRKTVRVRVVAPEEGPEVNYPDPYTVNQGNKADPKKLTALGGTYVFEGYYTDPELTKAFENPILDDDTAPTGEIVLYPKWTKVTVPIVVPEDPVTEPTTVPPTADANHPLLWAGMLSMSIVALGAAVMKKRKKDETV